MARGLARYLSSVAASQVLMVRGVVEAWNAAGSTADHAEQRRADTVLTRLQGVADTALRLENLLAGGGIRGQGTGSGSEEQQGDNRGAPQTAFALLCLDHHLNDPLGLLHCHDVGQLLIEDSHAAFASKPCGSS